MDIGYGIISQLAQSFFSEPDSLPSGDSLSVWLFERPLVVAGVLGALVLVLAWKAIQQSSRRLGMVAIVGVLVASGAYIAGQLVTTTSEHLMDQTGSLVAGVVNGETSRVDELISQDVSVVMGGSTIDGVGKQDVLDAMSMLPRVGVRDADVARLQAQIQGGNVGLTQARVRVDVGGTPAITWWRFDWRRESDAQWRVFRMRCLLINGREPTPSMFSFVR